MRKPKLPPAQAKELENKLSAAMDDMYAGDTDSFLKSADEIWDRLPEPKTGWDFFSQVVARDAVEQCIEVGKLNEAAIWLERAQEAYAPLSDLDHQIFDFIKAKLFYRAGEEDVAYAHFDAINATAGKRAFQDEPPIYWDFYQGRKTGRTPAQPGTPGSSTVVPPIGDGVPTGQDLSDDLHERVTRLFDEGDEHEDNDDQEAALRSFTQALNLLPTPRTQWDAALLLYGALADTLLALKQPEDAETALRIALQCPDGTGNGYIWLRLGDAHRDQSNPAAAVEAYTSAYMLEGQPIFDDTDHQDEYALLKREGIA